MFGIVEAIHFKFRTLIDTQEYYCMSDTPKGMCSESHDLFKFWEINNNISLTVRDSDIHVVAIED